MNIVFWGLVVIVMIGVWYGLSEFFIDIGDRVVYEKDRLKEIITYSEEEEE